MFSTIDSFDGTKIYYAKDIKENAKAVIIIVHGIAEHLGRYEYLKNKLLSFGYSVYRFDNRGHGKSGGRRGYIKSFSDFIKDTDKIVELVRSENKDLPIFMLGHSMGGFITACYGVSFKDKLRGQILSGAATNKLPLSLKMKCINFKYLIRGMVPNTLSKYLSTDTAVCRAYDNDPLVLKETSLKLNLEFSGNGIKWLVKKLPEYEYPCLILHGGNDMIVPPRCSKLFYENISSKDKELKIYPGLYHEIYNEKKKDIVIEDVHKWIEKRL